ncbi:heavy-metal-associated domain-containing protein [bacterium]|nr:heavy-metal-associated domain-containing protein [bacterium]
MKYQIVVNDMTCKHCQATIEQAINNIPGVENVIVNLDDKLVFVDGDVAGEKIVEAIRKAGYSPQNIVEEQ